MSLIGRPAAPGVGGQKEGCPGLGLQALGTAAGGQVTGRGKRLPALQSVAERRGLPLGQKTGLWRGAGSDRHWLRLTGGSLAKGWRRS